MIETKNTITPMDKFSLIKSISFRACQDSETSSQDLALFHRTVTPTILIELITQLEAKTKQLAIISSLYKEKHKTIERLIINSDSFKEKMSEFGLPSDRWHWPEIVEKRKNALETLSGFLIEDGSVLDAVLSIVALESRDGAYSTVAAALGIDSQALQAVLLSWEENQDMPPPPVSFDELKIKIMLHKQLAQAT